MSTPYEYEGEFGEYELGEFGETELEGERGRYRRWGGPPRRVRRRFRRRPAQAQPALWTRRRRRRRWPTAPFGGAPAPMAVEPEPFPVEPPPPVEPLPPMDEPPAPDGAGPPPADEPAPPAGEPAGPSDSPDEAGEYELNVQPESFEAYGEFGETESFETGAPPRRPSPAAAACVGLKQPEVIDRFAFDRDALTPAHLARLKRIAQCIVASQRTASPVRRVRLIGHTDPAGPPSYNKALGQRRAARVQQALKSAIDALQPGLSARLAFAVESRGEDAPIPGNPPASRRVEILLHRVAQPPARRGCPPFKERIRLHLKIIAQPKIKIPEMLRSMRQVYGPAGFKVEVASQEVLRIPSFRVLDIFCPGQPKVTCCARNKPMNPEHISLFRHRNRVRVNEIVVYFVKRTKPGVRGCAAHPPGRPGVVVAANATQWTLAHEVGHVLDLNHVDDKKRLMNGRKLGGTAGIIDPPPDLIPSEIQKMFRSSLTIPC